MDLHSAGPPSFLFYAAMGCSVPRYKDTPPTRSGPSSFSINLFFALGAQTPHRLDALVRRRGKSSPQTRMMFSWQSKFFCDFDQEHFPLLALRCCIFPARPGLSLRFYSFSSWGRVQGPVSLFSPGLFSITAPSFFFFPKNGIASPFGKPRQDSSLSFSPLLILAP